MKAERLPSSAGNRSLKRRGNENMNFTSEESDFIKRAISSYLNKRTANVKEGMEGYRFVEKEHQIAFNALRKIESW